MTSQATNATVPPPELEIVVAHDTPALAEAEGLINSVFEIHASAGSMLRPEIVNERFRVRIGRVDEQPVST